MNGKVLSAGKNEGPFGRFAPEIILPDFFNQLSLAKRSWHSTVKQLRYFFLPLLTSSSCILRPHNFFKFHYSFIYLKLLPAPSGVPCKHKSPLLMIIVVPSNLQFAEKSLRERQQQLVDKNGPLCQRANLDGGQDKYMAEVRKNRSAEERKKSVKKCF